MKVINRLCEHDIDVRLVEWLRGNAEVRQTFLQLAGREGWTMDHVANSVMHDGRECDIRLDLSKDGRHAVLLIENKIKAPFGDGQISAYMRTCEREIDLGREASVCLFSPAAYPSHNPGAQLFDLHITYEDVRDAIVKEGSPFSDFASSLFQQAIEKCRPMRKRANMRVPIHSNALHIINGDRDFLKGVVIQTRLFGSDSDSELANLLRYVYPMLVLPYLDRLKLRASGYIDEQAQLTEHGQRVLEDLVHWARHTKFAIPRRPEIVDGCGITESQEYGMMRMRERNDAWKKGRPVKHTRTSDERLPKLGTIYRELEKLPQRRRRKSQSAA